MKKIMKFIIGGLFILLVLGAIGNSSDTKKDTVKKETTKQEVKKQDSYANPTKVGPQELLDAYKDNEVAGNKKFKGKIIEMNVIIDSISTSLGSTYVLYRNTDSMEITQGQCIFKDSEVDKLASLKKGDNLTVVGKVDGKSIYVVVKDCVIK